MSSRNLIANYKLYPEVVIIGEMYINEVNIVEYTEKITWTNIDSSYKLLVSKNTTNSVDFYTSAIVREKNMFFHVKDIYFTSAKALATSTKQVNVWLTQLKLTKKLQTKGLYDHVIYLLSPYGNVYAHWLQDCLPQLISMPEEIIEKSMICIPFDLKQAKPYLEILGISLSKIIYDIDSWYFAKNLYLNIYAEPIHPTNAYTFQKLINILKDKLSINNIKGTRYVFTNRPHNKKRYIQNLKELILYVKLNIPYIKWEIDDLETKNLKEKAKLIASYKLWISPSGSNMMNMIFMNKFSNCGIYLIQSCDADYPNYGLAISLGLWTIGNTHKWKHHQKGGGKCDIYYGLTCIKRIIYAMENGKWPDSTFRDMMEAFDIQTIWKQMNKIPSSIMRVFYKGNYIYQYYPYYEFSNDLKSLILNYEYFKN